jgi:hypothetical protein
MRNPGCPGGKSFSGDTLVLLADGSVKPIDQVVAGDVVVATDPQTGRTETKSVMQTHVNNDTDLADLTIGLSDGSVSTLHTTSNHPFWSETRHDWAEAGELQPGEVLHAEDGTPVRVVAVHNFDGRAWMYNLSVDDIHTYYVVAGDTPVLVHNTGPCGVWHEGTFDSPEASFNYHYEKHGAPMNVTREQYLQDAQDWAARLRQPGGKTGLNAKRMPFDDGQFGVKYTDPNGGMGGIIGPDGRVVSFWYSGAN